LIDVAAEIEAFAETLTAVATLADTAPQLQIGAERLRAGGLVLTDDTSTKKPKKPRRW